MHTAMRTLKNEEWNSPHYSAFVRLWQECWVQFWSPQLKDMDILKRFQRRATKMFKGLENLPQDERLKVLDLFSPGNRRLRGELITVFQYLKGCYKEDEGSLFTRSHIGKTKHNGQVELALGEVSSQHEKFFYSKNNFSLEQPSQECSRVTIAEDFQDATGQGARWSHLGSLPHKWSDQMISWGDLQPGLFCDSKFIYKF